MNPQDVIGPYTGDVHRYYLDDVTVPSTSVQVRELGDDLDGDHTVDNQVGATLAALSSQGNDITPYARDILAASPAHSTLEIHADDLMNDPTVGVTLRGTDDDAMAVELGGRLAGGVFASNRTATAADLGRTTLHLPALLDADPSVLVLRYMEIDLTPDGHGGYNALIRGLVDKSVIEVASNGIVQMIRSNPADHAELIRLLDPGQTGMLSLSDIETNSLVYNLLQPDVTRDRTGYVSFGFAAHFAATAPTAVTDTCHDRILDGAETGVDCGANCLPCAGGESCGSPSDCQSRSCSGMCGEVSCADGVRDGIESDVDCGGWECGACAAGRACVVDSDCTSGHCLANQTCE
ncbi:MAG TPA: hypothetical protein VLT45_23180 [Kofleriaceae bacterium]|nr:hypothetical protein [Kofleriaceae bacterium]